MIKIGRLSLFGVITFFAGSFFYLASFFLWILGISLHMDYKPMVFMISIANIFFIITLILIFIDIVIINSIKGRKPKTIMYKPIENAKIGIGMTAYNDELSIEGAIKDFKKVKNLKNLVVIDNNCKDRTAELARKAGANVVVEKKQGYGYACMKAMKEAGGDIIILTEGDQTFRAADVKKLTAYIENVDMVQGTRVTMELLDQNSQLDWFLNWGNWFLAKLIQIKYWGRTRLTDVGCTYRAIRPEALRKILPHLKVGGSDFAPHITMVALREGLKVIEVPVTFKERVGESKAIGRNKIKGIKLGLKMLARIFLLD